MIHITEGLNEGNVILLNPPLKSAAVDSEDNKNLPGQVYAEDLQQKITERLNNIKTKEVDRQPPEPAADKIPDMEERRRRFENLTPEQREEMRRRFEQMSPEERERIRKQWQGR